MTTKLLKLRRFIPFMGEKSVLIVCAHPDDEILGVGGTIAKYAKEGKDIYSVVFSAGHSSHPLTKEKVIEKVRSKESTAAGKIVGCKETILLGLKDGSLKSEIQKKKVVTQLRRIIKEKKPEKIFTHSMDDPHPDHKAVYNSVREATKSKRSNVDIYSFDIWNPFNIRRRSAPKLIVDITETFPKKIRAIKRFKSQKVAMFTMLPAVYLRAYLNGLNNHVRYAEVFLKIK